MTALLDRVTVDQITAQARQASPGRALLTLLGALLMGLGWLVAWAYRGAFVAGAWAFTAARMGWLRAHGKPLSQPSLSALMAENARLRAEIGRLS